MKHKILTLMFVTMAGLCSVTAAITVHLNPYSVTDWNEVYLYSWTGNGDTQPTGGWPGTAVYQDEYGWWSYTFDSNLQNVNIIWNNGQGAQTVDIVGVTTSTYYELLSTSGNAINVSVLYSSSEPVNINHVKIGDLYYKLDFATHEATVTYENAYWDSSNYINLTSVNIPASVSFLGHTFSVTKIGEHAFLYSSNINSITLPNTIVGIDYSAFGGCSSLASINIPSSVTYIEGWAFDSCTGLQSVYITDLNAWLAISFESSPMYYAHSLYLNGVEITELVIPEGVTIIKPEFFGSMNNLTSVYIPSSVTYIYDDSFAECPNLTSVTINSNTLMIRGDEMRYLFGDQVQEYILGDSVGNIGAETFSNCSSLQSVILPNSLLYIGEDAFENCKGLKSIIIPNSVMMIDRRAFYRSGLTSITIPGSVWEVRAYAFGDTSLDSITISATTLIHEDAFESSPISKINIIGSLEDVCRRDWRSVKVHYDLYLNGDMITDLTIPSTIDSIGTLAFIKCSSITSVTMPNTVTYIAPYAFSGCDNLAFVSLSDSISDIYESTFAECSSLTSIEIPSSVTKIWSHAFFSSTNLQTVTLHNVGTIDQYAFANCTGLQYIYNYRERPSLAYSNTFDGIDKFNCTLFVPEASIDMYRVATAWSEFYYINPLSGTSDLEELPSNETTNSSLNESKLIHNGQILILRDGKTYSITGQEVK